MGGFFEVAHRIGRASTRRDIVGPGTAGSEKRAAALDALETIGLIQEQAGGFEWASPGSPDLLTRLVALRDGPARALLPLPMDPLCPVVVCATPNGPVDGRPRLSNWGGAAGSGLIVRDAALSCLFEVAERCSQMRHGDEEITVAPYAELADQAIHPMALLQASARQMVQPESPSGIVSLQDTVPIAWAAARDLRGGRARYVATDFCYRSSVEAHGSWTCPSDTNGCATGWNLEAATVKGFLELVERDAAAIWWFNRVRRPSLPPAVLELPALRAVSDWQDASRRRFHLLDLTSDLGIPVVAAVSYDEDGLGIAVGFGAHFDPMGAAVRAAFEMAQFQLMIALSLGYRAQGRLREVDPGTAAAWAWYEEVSIRDETYLMPDPAAVTAERWPVGGASRELDTCLAVAERHGLEMLSVDMTRDSIGVPAVRVIVPGLRPAKPRFAPGRLFDVPVALKWRSSRCAEQDLNQRALVF